MRLVLLVVASLVVGLASADEVVLRDGRVLEGEVVSQPDDATLSIRRGSGSMVVVQHVPAAQVERVVYGKNERQQAVETLHAEAAALGDGGDAEAWWALADRARGLGDRALARDYAQQVVLRDRRHQPARRLLGMTQVKGVWMRPNEAAIATGQILVDGRWMTWSDRIALAAEQAKRQELAAVRRREAEQRRAAARVSAELPYGPIDVPGYSSSYGATYGYGYGYGVPWHYPGNGVPTVVSWPGSYTSGVYSSGSYCPPNLVVAGSGSSGNTSWAFRWSW